MSMRGKTVALVTGASSGNGKEIAKQLFAEGYVVYAAARRIDKMANLEKLGATAIKMDIFGKDLRRPPMIRLSRYVWGRRLRLNHSIRQFLPQGAAPISMWRWRD